MPKWGRYPEGVFLGCSSKTRILERHDSRMQNPGTHSCPPMSVACGCLLFLGCEEGKWNGIHQAERVGLSLTWMFTPLVSNSLVGQPGERLTNADTSATDQLVYAGPGRRNVFFPDEPRKSSTKVGFPGKHKQALSRPPVLQVHMVPDHSNPLKGRRKPRCLGRRCSVWVPPFWGGVLTDTSCN